MGRVTVSDSEICSGRQHSMIIGTASQKTRQDLLRKIEPLSQSGFYSLADTSSYANLDAFLGAYHPEIALIDLSGRALFDLTSAKIIRQTHPETSLLFMSPIQHPSYVKHLFNIRLPARSIASGAIGCVPLSSSQETFEKALNSLLHRQNYLYPSVKDGIVESTNHPQLLDHLTSREFDTFVLIGRDLTNKQVASELGISIKTVEKHRMALCDKLYTAVHNHTLSYYAARWVYHQELLAKGIINNTNPCFEEEIFS